MLGPLRDDSPRRIGTYGIRARLGAGGMGEVFLGAPDGGDPVAVKMVRRDVAQDPGFRREIAVARSVTGPHVAPLLDGDADAEVRGGSVMYPEAADRAVPGRRRRQWQHSPAARPRLRRRSGSRDAAPSIGVDTRKYEHDGHVTECLFELTRGTGRRRFGGRGRSDRPPARG
jgi:hypothetical protein